MIERKDEPCLHDLATSASRNFPNTSILPMRENNLKNSAALVALNLVSVIAIAAASFAMFQTLLA